MQTNIQVGDDAITGTLKYVDNAWDPGTWPADKASGNYIALKFESDEDAEVTVEVVGGDDGPKPLDSDMSAIFRITDVATQSIKVVVTKEGMTTTTKIYDLSDLILEPEE